MMPQIMRSIRPQNRMTKRQILVTIIATSCVWIALDIFMFYNSAAYSSTAGNKLPVERRKLHNSAIKFLDPLKHAQSSRADTILFHSPHETNIISEKSSHILTGASAFAKTEEMLTKTSHVETTGLVRSSKHGSEKLMSENSLLGVVKTTDKESDIGLYERLSFATVVFEEASMASRQRETPSLSPHESVYDKTLTKVQQKNEPALISRPLSQNIRNHTIGSGSIRIKNIDVRLLEFDPKGPGEHGKGVNTFPWEESKVKEGWARASFNEYVSDKISLERSIPDPRNHRCKVKNYDYSILPKTTIIICFTEESWSTLLRSLHSVLNRTPPELLHEVLLVDDFSQTTFQGRSLEKYISKFPKVRLIRLSSRHGLVKARLAGIKNTTGEVITFLDSHIECNKGWLEPLLDTIRSNRKVVVSPIIDTISDQTFQYMSAAENLRGGFIWTLEFRWTLIDKYRPDPTDNIITPTIAGGLFSINRNFFHELGLYDPGLEIWGSENLELSFKTWMCGGKLEIVPCSRVGHVFRATQPYKFPKGNVVTFLHNNIRIAEVWMDEYKVHFYNVFPKLRKSDAGDISSRVETRRQMNCRSFKWYLDNIYPELNVPSLKVIAGGGLKNIGHNLCLDRGLGTGPITLATCHGFGGTQHFQLTHSGIIETVDLCVGRTGATLAVATVSCKRPGVLSFRHDRSNGSLVSKVDGKCLTVVGPTFSAQLMPCQRNDNSQMWSFLEYFNATENTIDE